MEYKEYTLTGAEELETAELTLAKDVVTLEGETSSDAPASNDDGNKGGFNWAFPIIIVVVFVMIIAWFLLSGRKNKSGEKEYLESLDAIRPGNKVTSRGGICGIVVEVCDDNTVILETGSEASGKSRVKLMKECIYETDAKGPTQIAREEAELRRKQEKEAKAAAKNAKKEGLPPPTEAEDAPAPELPEEKPEELDGDNKE